MMHHAPLRSPIIACLALALGGVAPAGALAEVATLEVWNIDLAAVEPDAVPEEVGSLEAVRIAGAGNGWFSGKLMVAGSGLDGLRATVSDLEHVEAGEISSERVAVRYGRGWDGMPGWYRPRGLDVLTDAPAGEAATTSVWITVDVPADAAAGEYAGEVVLRAGDAEVRVPVELRVAAWSLPDVGEYRTWIDMAQSPDTLAVEYDVELWSEAHWELIGQSMALMGELGNRTLYLPLIAQTNLGNEQSMVRWMPKGDGGYGFDLSIAERYVDLALERMGEPGFVVLNAWDVYQVPADNQWDDEWWEGLSDDQRRNGYFIGLYERGQLRRELQSEHGLGPMVTVVEEGALAMVALPPYTEAVDAEPWRALFDELRGALGDRGLADRMVLGMLTDSWPTTEELEALATISDGLAWVSHAHWSAYGRRGGTVRNVAGLAFETTVWDVAYSDPDEPARGWQREEIVLAHYRMRGLNGVYPTRMRTVVESNITGQQRGLGRVGGDLWWALRDRRGQRRGTVAERYPQSLWRNLDIRSSLLAPGPEGPVPTARFMHLREGLQEAEARIAIEEALLEHEATLDAGLVAEARALLEARHRAAWRENGQDEAYLEQMDSDEMPRHQQDGVGYAWFVASDWQGRSERLYELAGRVARAAGEASAPHGR
ncbi:MAG: glycoside hydrolase domain-containing protein [Phycisphaeraceae bacterium]